MFSLKLELNFYLTAERKSFFWQKKILILLIYFIINNSL